MLSLPGSDDQRVSATLKASHTSSGRREILSLVGDLDENGLLGLSDPLRVYLALLLLDSEDALEWLAEYLDISDAVAQSGLDWLIDNGWIKCDEQPDGTTAVYVRLDSSIPVVA